MWPAGVATAAVAKAVFNRPIPGVFKVRFGSTSLIMPIRFPETGRAGRKDGLDRKIGKKTAPNLGGC